MKCLAAVQKFALVGVLLSSALLFSPRSVADIFELPKFIALLVGTEVFVLASVFQWARAGRLCGARVDGVPPRAGFRALLRGLPSAFFFLALFMAGSLLAYIFSTQPHMSLIGAPYRFQGLISDIHYALFFIVTFFYFKSSETGKAEKIFLWLVGGLVVTCVLAMLPYLVPIYIFEPALYADRLYGVFGNPNYLAVFIITALPFLVLERTRLPRTVWLFLMALALATLFLTGARSAWIASMVGFVLWGLFEAVRFKKYKILAGCATIFCLLLVGVALQKNLSSAVLTRLSVGAENFGSVRTRLYLWRAGFELFARRPLTGYGQDALKGNIEPYVPEYLKENTVFFVDRTHSELVDMLAMRGIFGFVGYVGFLAMVFWKSGRKIFYEHAVARPYFTAAFFGFLTLNLFHAVNFSTISSNVLLYFLAAYLCVAALNSRPEA